MNNFSLKRLYKEYPYEALLVSSSFLILCLSLAAFILSFKPPSATPLVYTANLEKRKPLGNQIVVDVSGSVEKPDMYIFTDVPRLKEVLERAGGLNQQADAAFVQRNFNLSRFVSDQEKIYVPSQSEIANKIFLEDQRTLQYLSPVNTSSQTTTQGIHINSASAKELESLDGIGSTLANAIVSHRPYSDINDLLTKKVLKTTQFTKIKDQISL